MNDKLKALAAKFTSGLSLFWSKLNSDVGELWKESKGFLIVFGALIAVIKFREILINLIVANSKSIFDSAVKKDDAEHKEENKDNDAANQLIKDADKLTNDEAPITDDWNKK